MKLIHKLLNPVFLLGLLVFSLPFERIPSYNIAGVDVRPDMVIGALLIFSVILKKQWRIDFPYKILIGFSATALLSALISAHRGRSLVVTAFIIFVFIVSWAASKTVQLANLRWLEKLLFYSTLIVCVFALYQFVGDLFGLPTWLTGLKFGYTKDVFGFPRVQAASMEPLYFANFLLLPLSLFGVMHYRKKSHWLLLMLILTCVLLTVSRAGIVVAVLITLGLVLWGLVQRNWAKAGTLTLAIIGGFVISYAAISIATPFIVGLTSSSEKSRLAAKAYRDQATNFSSGESADDRARTRNLAIEEFKQLPVVGGGPGSFGYFAHNHNPLYKDRQTVNNITLEVLAETGVIGGILLAFYGLSLVFFTSKALMRSGVPADSQNWIIGLSIFITGTFLQYQTFSPLYITYIWVAIGLLSGLSFAYAKQK